MDCTRRKLNRPGSRIAALSMVTGLSLLAASSPCHAGESADRTLGAVLGVGSIIGAVLPGPHQDARPDEIIPRGSWIYDVLGGLAHDGALPYPSEYFQGAHLMTRGELATMIVPLLAGTTPLVAPASGGASPLKAPSLGGTPSSATPVPSASPLGSPTLGGTPAPEIPANGTPSGAPAAGTPAAGTPAAGTPALPPGAAPASAPGSTAGATAGGSEARDSRVALLKWEFRSELALMGRDVAGLVQPTNLSMTDGAYARAQLGLTRNRLHPRLMARGHVEGAWNSFAYTASFGNINPGAFERPFQLSSLPPGPVTAAGRELTYDGDSLYLRGLDRLAVSRTFSGWRLELGRDWLQWGQSYSGSLILSDNSGPLDMFLVSKDFNLGRLGTFRFHQFEALDQEPGAQRYLLGRRLEKTLSGSVDAAVSETLVSQGAPSVLDLILPFYVGEHSQIKHDTSVDAKENYLIDFQLAYHDQNQRRYYGDILIDDITLPWAFHGQSYAPRKAGFLAGMAVPNLHGRLQSFLLEAVFTDGISPVDATYLHRNPNIAYARYGNMIGNPIGPDSRGIVARLDLAPYGAWRTFAQATIEQHHRHFVNPDSETAILFSGSREIKPGYSVVLSAKPVLVTNPGTAGTPGSRLEAQAYVSAQF